MVTEEPKLLMSWGFDTDYEEEEGVGYSDDFDDKWDNFCEMLTEYMEERSPDGEWHCEVTGFGWQKLRGWVDFTAYTGKDLLREILPRADNSFKIYDHENGKGFRINNFHHDSPVGAEWYTVMPRAEGDE
jgi:hypothetical protein